MTGRISWRRYWDQPLAMSAASQVLSRARCCVMASPECNERRVAASAIETHCARRLSHWPISYTSIETIVCTLDVLLIIGTSAASAGIYSSLFHRSEIDLIRQIATGAVVCVVFVSFFRNRRLYDPTGRDVDCWATPACGRP